MRRETRLCIWEQLVVVRLLGQTSMIRKILHVSTEESSFRSPSDSHFLRVQIEFHLS